MFEMKELTKEKLRAFVERCKNMSDKEIYFGFGNKYEVEPIMVNCDKGERNGCEAKCCYKWFGLSPQDIKEGIQFNEKFPFTIKQREDNSCIYLDRKELKCSIWKKRPEICKTYTCKNDSRIGIFIE